MAGIKTITGWTALAGLTLFVAAPARAGFVVSPANGHSYEVIADSVSSWAQADAAAQAAGGHLVTITSADENQFVDRLLISSDAPTGSYWMGLRRSGAGATGDFQAWTTGEKLDYTNWTAGVPDDWMGVEDVASILWTHGIAGAASTAAASDASTFSRRGQWNDLADSGFPHPGGNPTQADLLRGGFVVEKDGQQNVVPLPAAAALFAPTAALAALAARRLRRRRS